MVDQAIIREWAAKAEEDFQFARINLEERKNFFAQICFHFQQAAEKYLKSFIVATNIEFRKIHDLGVLLKICSEKDRSFEELREDAEFLSAFYTDARYPVYWTTSFSRQEAEKALQAAARIRERVRSRLNLVSV